MGSVVKAVRMPHVEIYRDLRTSGQIDWKNLSALLSSDSSCPMSLVSQLQDLVQAGLVDRIAARAILLILNGQLDPRDLRQLLPRDQVRVKANIATKDDAKRDSRCDAPAGLTKPESFGRYRVEGIIRRGRNANVYRSRHPDWDCPVAIKVANPGSSPDLIRNEANTLALIHHTNVLRLWDANLNNDSPFLVSQYLPGGSVLRWLQRRGRLPWRQIVSITCDTVRGLRAAYRAGFIHGDIKPSNLLLTRERRVVIADFGVARPLKASHLLPDHVFGSWPYLAPECFHGAGDYRSDIYSLGLTMYQMLTGVQPVLGASRSLCLEEHLKLHLDPPHWFVPDAPAAMSGLILRMVAKEPHLRPDSYDEILNDLRQFAKPQR